MSETLEDLFAQESRPTDGAAFRINLMERMARRRFLMRLGASFGSALLIFVLLLPLSGTLSILALSLGQSIGDTGMTLSWLAALGVGAWWLQGNLKHIPLVRGRR